MSSHIITSPHDHLHNPLRMGHRVLILALHIDRARAQLHLLKIRRPFNKTSLTGPNPIGSVGERHIFPAPLTRSSVHVSCAGCLHREKKSVAKIRSQKNKPIRLCVLLEDITLPTTGLTFLGIRALNIGIFTILSKVVSNSSLVLPWS